MRYAKALMAYAEERGAEERLYHELVTLAHSFRTVKGFCAVLDNPIVSVNEKFNLICTAADGDHKPSEEFIRFIRLVLKERRETYLQFMKSDVSGSLPEEETHRCRETDHCCSGRQSYRRAYPTNCCTYFACIYGVGNSG